MQANLRAVAANDIDAAAAYYRNEAGPQIALDFVDALEAAINHLRQHPLTGSLRFGYELEIPELRSWPLQKFPYIIFYMPDDDQHRHLARPSRPTGHSGLPHIGPTQLNHSRSVTCTDKCVGGASVTLSTRAAWNAELAAG